MREYIWLYHTNINYVKYPVRNSFKSIAGYWEFPVDRFGVTDGQLEIPCKPIIKSPEFNLLNLTQDWKERYFSVLDTTAEDIYRLADEIKGPSGRRTITLLYSGGVDSLVALVSLQRHPKYREFLEAGKIKLAMTSGSINEYPEFFYQKILPEIPIRNLNFFDLMHDADAFLVTGDLGDYVIQSSDALVLLDGDKTFDLTSNWQNIIPHIRKKDKVGRYLDVCWMAKKREPFAIESAGQMIWWLSQCFTYQDEFVRPYIWSNTKELDSISTNDKVYRFFFNDDITKFSYEFMSTNPRFTNYEEARYWAKEYIVNHIKDPSYMDKPKVYSQRSSFRLMNKTRIFIENGRYGYDMSSEAI